ncbi:MAG: hypothetical protein U1E29_11500 [Coriobacteriia bacterium]|nr:hypothetical protein [Coriobacteriia bacterium]
MWRRSLVVLLSALVLAAGVATGCAGPEDLPSFTRLGIPEREHGYGTFDSVTIGSPQELEEFLESSRGIGWNAWTEFEDALRDANVDFEREVLVLLRHTEPSGSNGVALSSAAVTGRTLLVPLTVSRAEIGPADMAYYCFAFVVSRADIDQVTLQPSLASGTEQLPSQTLKVQR